MPSAQRAPQHAGLPPATGSVYHGCAACHPATSAVPLPHAHPSLAACPPTHALPRPTCPHACPPTRHHLLLAYVQVCILLLSFRASVCAGTAGLRQGYHVAQQAFIQAVHPLALLHGAADSAGRHGDGAAAVPLPVAAPQAPAAQQLVPDLQLCVQGQVLMVLLPGFVGAVWVLYRTELRLRLRWLAALQCQREQLQVAAHLAAQPSGSNAVWPAGAFEGRDAQHDGLACRLPADVAGLTADQAPSDLDFLLNFALPAVAAMWLFAC